MDQAILFRVLKKFRIGIIYIYIYILQNMKIKSLFFIIVD